MTRCRAIILSLLLTLFLPAALQAVELPRWEAGAGATLFSMPDYRGSDRTGTYAYPIPYLIYRGDELKIDRRSVRGIFYKSERIELDTSLNGAPPVKSSGDSARAGMPDLDATLEFGPSLKIRLDNGADAGFRSELQLPLRASLTTDFSYLRYTGLVFTPRLNFDWGRFTSKGRWSAGFALGPVFIDTKNARWYYSVDPVYANLFRPRYEAHGGYAGLQLAAAGTIRTNGLWFGLFARVDNLRGARFEDSPLVKEKWNATAGLAAAWIFGESEKKVQSEEW